MFCMNCGKKLPEGARFCTDCGYAVLPVQFADAGTAPAAEPQTPEPPRAQTAQAVSPPEPAPVAEPAAAPAGAPPEGGAGPEQGEITAPVTAVNVRPAAPFVQPEFSVPAPERPSHAAAEPVRPVARPEVTAPAAPAQATITAPAPAEPIQPVATQPASIPPAAPVQATPAPAPRGKGKARLRWLAYVGIAAAAFALGMLAMILVRRADAAEARSPKSAVIGAGKAAAAIEDTPQPAETAEQAAAVSGEVTPSMTLADLDCDPPIYDEGETLYIGRMRFDWAEQSTMAFILSADGAKVRNIKIHNKNMDFDLPESGGHVSDWTVTEEFAMSFPYVVGGTMDMGRCQLDDVVIDGDRASAVLTYSYFYRSLDGSVEETVGLGSAPVEFVRYDAAYGAAAEEWVAVAQQTEEPAGTKTSSAVVRFEDKEYVCTIGDIGLSDAYKLTVTVEAPGIGAVIPIRNDRLIVPVQASVIALYGETYEWTRVSTTTDSLTFEFDTTADPYKIVLYPDGGKDDESTWAVYDVAQQTFTQLF